MAMKYLVSLLVVTILMIPTSSSVSGNLVSSDRPTWDAATAVSNFNQFKTNLDKGQEYLISIYKTVYGGISAFWFAYSYWLVLSIFYYTFGVTYLNARDEAEAEFKIHENEIKRALDLSQINLNSIFSKLRTIHEKTSGKLGDSCYQRGLCEVRSYFSKTQFYNWIPKFLRRILRLEPQSREAGTCGEIHRACTLTSLLASLIQ